MTQEKSINDNIQDWLLKKGFPFEIKCARTLLNHDFKIQPSIHYLDSETNNYREIDICAYKSYKVEDFTFNLTLIIECKTSEIPWLMFRHEPMYLQSELLKNIIISNNGLDLLTKIDINDAKTFAFSYLKDEPIGYNFIQMRENKEKDHAYEAIMQSSKAALALKDQSNKSNLKFCNLYIPVVIVDKNLYSVSDAKESLDLKIEEIKYCKHGKLFAFQERSLLIHHMVSGTYLDEYCKTISQDFDYFAEKYFHAIKDIALKNPTNSTDGKYSFF